MGLAVGNYFCDVTLHVGPTTSSVRLKVEGSNLIGSFIYLYDWNLAVTGQSERHRLRIADSSPDLDPASFAVWDIDAPTAKVTATPYDAPDGGQGSGSAGDSTVLDITLPADGGGLAVADTDAGLNMVARKVVASSGGSLKFTQSGDNAELALRLTVSTGTPTGTPGDGEIWFQREA